MAAAAAYRGRWVGRDRDVTTLEEEAPDGRVVVVVTPHAATTNASQQVVMATMAHRAKTHDADDNDNRPVVLILQFMVGPIDRSIEPRHRMRATEEDFS